MDKRSLTERDICTKFIPAAVKRAGWDDMVWAREEVYFTRGPIIVRGKLVTRGKARKANTMLYYKPSLYARSNLTPYIRSHSADARICEPSKW